MLNKSVIKVMIMRFFGDYKRVLYSSCLILMVFTFNFGCQRSAVKETSQVGEGDSSRTQSKEDILVGTLNVLVDEAGLSLAEEQKEVFLSSYYNAKVNLIAKPEVMAVQDLLSEKAGVAILARKLNEEEEGFFTKRGIVPRVFPVWSDAIVLINNTNSQDTSVRVEDVFKIMQGSAVGKKLVFHNINSSHFRLLKDLGNIDKVASNFVDGVNEIEELLEAIEADAHAVGVLGYNEYLNFKSSLSNKNNIRILSLGNTVGEHADGLYYKPSQSTIATQKYPLRHTFYVMNYQPNMGLGVGFSAFVTGDRGQRIVLKSGLLPATMPGRELIIRDKI
ncbi:substrate-binding domain-containing protein [Sphingobacterium sp. UT-1RO-CII-1]|uniref:PstS family phosphate ABC transporter substrate-binding protein n=1 Tax=Sphingobacterium sp. UT-1RO-CII-1 TaxID=2995225 RepID=UPI00227BC992|nr:substrate-binding domain-containing protein [Sphingobacterium sp. UT-1RO-CII-1]MCY4780842.1 substrate-binding domain-containing protein [Sphingobacterium sp. UT-1RO-CII-1]